MAYLEGKNLVASYGVVPILHECSVEVEKGELAVIVGPNGAGKSTVMRVLLGMLNATSGSVSLDGRDISCLLYTSPSPRDRSLSRMPSSA